VDFIYSIDTSPQSAWCYFCTLK